MNLRCRRLLAKAFFFTYLWSFWESSLSSITYDDEPSLSTFHFPNSHEGTFTSNGETEQEITERSEERIDEDYDDLRTKTTKHKNDQSMTTKVKPRSKKAKNSKKARRYRHSHHNPRDEYHYESYPSNLETKLPFLYPAPSDDEEFPANFNNEANGRPLASKSKTITYQNVNISRKVSPHPNKHENSYIYKGSSERRSSENSPKIENLYSNEAHILSIKIRKKTHKSLKDHNVSDKQRRQNIRDTNIKPIKHLDSGIYNDAHAANPIHFNERREFLHLRDKPVFADEYYPIESAALNDTREIFPIPDREYSLISDKVDYDQEYPMENKVISGEESSIGTTKLEINMEPNYKKRKKTSKRKRKKFRSRKDKSDQGIVKDHRKESSKGYFHPSKELKKSASAKRNKGFYHLEHINNSNNKEKDTIRTIPFLQDMLQGDDPTIYEEKSQEGNKADLLPKSKRNSKLKGYHRHDPANPESSKDTFTNYLQQTHPDFIANDPKPQSPCYSLNDLLMVILMTSLVNLVAGALVTFLLCCFVPTFRYCLTGFRRNTKSSGQLNGEGMGEEDTNATAGCLEACLPDISYQRHIARGSQTGLSISGNTGSGGVSQMFHNVTLPELKNVFDGATNRNFCRFVRRAKKKCSLLPRRSLSLEDLADT